MIPIVLSAFVINERWIFSKASSLSVVIIMIFLLKYINVIYYPNVLPQTQQNFSSCNKFYLVIIYLKATWILFTTFYSKSSWPSSHLYLSPLLKFYSDLSFSYVEQESMTHMVWKLFWSLTEFLLLLIQTSFIFIKGNEKQQCSWDQADFNWPCHPNQ